MKKTFKLFASVMAIAILTSCGTAVQPTEFKVNPNPLTVVGNVVEADITGTFPVKKFGKKAVLTVTPVLKYEGGEALAKSVTLYTIDEHWKEHLREMDDLKQSVQNATYEQKDPLLIYKFESFNLFKKILEKISRDVIAFMSRVNIPLRRDEDIPVREEQRKPRTDLSKMQLGRNDLSTNGGEPKSNGPIRVEKKVGRNDPCPCGSGKKFKNCHGRGM